MIHDYLDSFIVGVGNNPTDIMNIASDETEKIKQYLKGELTEKPYANAIHIAPYQSLDGIRAQLKAEYGAYDITLLETYGRENHSSEYVVNKNSDETFVKAGDDIPYRDYDSWIVIITSVPYNDIKANPSLLDTEFLVAYGVNFVVRHRVPMLPPEPTDTVGPAKLKYVQSLTVKGQEEVRLNKLTNETQTFLDIINGTKQISKDLYPTGTHYSIQDFRGIEFVLKEEYQDLYVGLMRIEGDEGEVDDYEFENNYLTSEYNSERVLRWNPIDSFFFIVSNVKIEDIRNNPSLAETNFLHVYGITMKKGEEPEEIDELPPETINTTDLNDTQFVRVLDGTTLAEYSIVPDVYNVKISQSINGAYTLNFNLLPYTNASNIYTPRIVEVDNEYFHVQTITKRHELQNLEMDIHCEHVSYELNYPPSVFFDDIAGKHVWTEDNYVGTAKEILEEMLQYNGRFTIGLVEDTREHIFTTSTEGFRSRINEFAADIGLEVKWSKFTVSLLKKRGHDNGLVVEVGKNIIGLTEVIDTVKLGKTKRSYELDVIDLNYVEDDLENPLEAHNISIGDVITIINSQYRINRKDRVVALTYDPFRKALPTIEFTNTMSSFTNNSDRDSGTGGAAFDLEFYQEEISRNTKANALGYKARASGLYSLSVGENTVASGMGAVALGKNSTADGITALSCGTGAMAMGSDSIAVGLSTETRASYSQAFGWNAMARGFYSHAQGDHATASGQTSYSSGEQTVASAKYSRATGYQSVASGVYSNASGNGSIASGQTSFATGYQCEASGYLSFAQGYMSKAIGSQSFAGGFNSNNSGSMAFVFGQNCTATMSNAVALGHSTKASAIASTALGLGTIANKEQSLVIGSYNKELTGTGDYIFSQPLDQVFVIGNGTSWVRSNAVTVNRAGTINANGSFNTGGADYSEYFEWVDGNANDEDRKGYVVTVENDKIRLANANDNYVLGVISVNPSVIGNAHENQWHSMYVTDEWGMIQYHYVDLPHEEIDENGNEITVYRKAYVPIVNPNYNPDTEYIPRSQRKEWDTVGMLGKLLVYDDRTCQINKYAKLSETVDGILSHSDKPSQFFVLRRINDKLVEVLIK